MSTRDDTYSVLGSHQVDGAYIHSLQNTAAALMIQAAEADRRGIAPLAATLTTAAASAARWAKALEEATK